MAHTTPEQQPRGFLALGIFFFFGALMATFAATTLLKPGTFLDRAWVLNPTAHVQLVSVGKIAGFGFIALAVPLLLAGVGWFRRRYWGWVVGTSVIAVNLLGDLGQIGFGERLKGVTGVLIAGLLLVYMTRPGVRNYFR
ncbi:MAG: hypothetical protein LAO03_09375 [Acidobacteriia bacterium]|nr:hypothetical protein [Terriglobia bacterium]